MFWIGFIVGIITIIVAATAFIVYCLSACGLTYDDVCRMSAVNTAAITNRTCSMEVWHDGHCVYGDTFEVHE